MRALLPALSLTLCACGPDETFDERFSGTENSIEQRARELDNELEPSTINASDPDSDRQPI